MFHFLFCATWTDSLNLLQDVDGHFVCMKTVSGF